MKIVIQYRGLGAKISLRTFCCVEFIKKEQDFNCYLPIGLTFFGLQLKWHLLRVTNVNFHLINHYNQRFVQILNKKQVPLFPKS